MEIRVSVDSGGIRVKIWVTVSVNERFRANVRLQCKAGLHAPISASGVCVIRVDISVKVKVMKRPGV